MAATASASLYLQSSGYLLHSRSSSSSTKLAYLRRSKLVLPDSRTRRGNAFQGLHLAFSKTVIDLHKKQSYSVLQALQFSSVESLGDQKAAAKDIKDNLDEKEQVIISNTENGEDVELEKGYKMTSVCDRLIDVFMIEKPNSSDWRKLLVFTDEWTKIKPHFFERCRMRADGTNDPENKQNLLRLIRKVKEVDEDMQRHDELLKQVRENPLQIDAIVARRRKDFTKDFFDHLKIINDSYRNNLEAKDELARVATTCLTALEAYDTTIVNNEALSRAQLKFDEILNSPSLEVACNKMDNLAKQNELDSAFILTVSKAWASARDSQMMDDEVRDIMFHLYVEMRQNLQKQVPKEVRIIKRLIAIQDPQLRLTALTQAFTPGDEIQGKDGEMLYTTPKELYFCYWLRRHFTTMGNCIWTNFGSEDMLEVISNNGGGARSFQSHQLDVTHGLDLQLENVAPCRLSSGTAADLLSKIKCEPSLEVVPSQHKGIWKVKLVISVEQLHHILAHQSNTEALIERMSLTASASTPAPNQAIGCFSRASHSSWKPSLESISELPPIVLCHGQ